MFAAKIRNFIVELKIVAQRIASCYSETGYPALCYNTTISSSFSQNQEFTVADIAPSILFAVPRNRRTLQKRLIRKNTIPEIKSARPKKNIVICLNCGHAHERETLCGNCYAKVRAETQKFRAAMDEDTYYYNHPRQEVGYYYKGETTDNIPKYKGRYLVEIDDERPSWFPTNLLKKDN